jgi:hypothetical protein
MNSLTSFIKARFTDVKPIQIKQTVTRPIVDSFGYFGQLDRPPFTIDWNWTLRVERAFGKYEQISGMKMEMLRWYVTEEAAKETKNLKTYSSRFTKIEDGGRDFLDMLMFRGAGDTPIAICEHVTPLILLADNLHFTTPHSIDHGQGPFYVFIRNCAQYVYKYRPAVLNNHLTWKALFLLLAGHYLKYEEYINWAAGAYKVCLEQIDDDGYMPLELERGDKAASYTRMNLEALNFMSEVLSRFYAMDFVSPKLELANQCFYRCLTEHDAWKDKRDIKKQQLPDNIYSWAWVLTGTQDKQIKAFRNAYYKPMDRNQNAYIYNFIP